MGAAAPNPGHTFPIEGKYAKVDRGVLRIPPSEPHNAPLLGLRPAAQASQFPQLTEPKKRRMKTMRRSHEMQTFRRNPEIL